MVDLNLELAVKYVHRLSRTSSGSTSLVRLKQRTLRAMERRTLPVGYSPGSLVTGTMTFPPISQPVVPCGRRVEAAPLKLCSWEKARRNWRL